jgi:putative endonuclease
VIEKTFFVYILASRPHGAIYIGVTSNLHRRMYEHMNGIIEGHTKKYNIKQLVHYEMFGNAQEAIWREKCLKKWTRAMKNDLIDRNNPVWEDLYPALAVA